MAIAYYSLGICGYQINEIEHDCGEYYVKFVYVGTQREQKQQRRKVYTTSTGRAYFNTGHRRIYLDECLRTNI